MPITCMSSSCHTTHVAHVPSVSRITIAIREIKTVCRSGIVSFSCSWDNLREVRITRQFLCCRRGDQYSAKILKETTWAVTNRWGSLCVACSLIDVSYENVVSVVLLQYQPNLTCRATCYNKLGRKAQSILSTSRTLYSCQQKFRFAWQPRVLKPQWVFLRVGLFLRRSTSDNSYASRKRPCSPYLYCQATFSGWRQRSMSGELFLTAKGGIVLSTKTFIKRDVPAWLHVHIFPRYSRSLCFRPQPTQL